MIEACRYMLYVLPVMGIGAAIYEWWRYAVKVDSQTYLMQARLAKLLADIDNLYVGMDDNANT